MRRWPRSPPFQQQTAYSSSSITTPKRRRPTRSMHSRERSFSLCGPSRRSERARKADSKRSSSAPAWRSKRTSASPNGAPPSRAPPRDLDTNEPASQSRSKGGLKELHKEVAASRVLDAASGRRLAIGVSPRRRFDRHRLFGITLVKTERQPALERRDTAPHRPVLHALPLHRIDHAADERVVVHGLLLGRPHLEDAILAVDRQRERDRALQRRIANPRVALAGAHRQLGPLLLGGRSRRRATLFRPLRSAPRRDRQNQHHCPFNAHRLR